MCLALALCVVMVFTFTVHQWGGQKFVCLKLMKKGDREKRCLCIDVVTDQYTELGASRLSKETERCARY